MKIKKTKILSIITISTLLLAVFGATFAYFTATGDVKGTLDLTVMTSSRNQTITTSTDVSLFVNASDMQELKSSNSYNSYKEANVPGEIMIQTTVGSSGGTSRCTYDVVYITNSSKMYYKSSTNTSNLREYVILIEAIEDNATHSGNDNIEMDLTNKNGTITLASNQTIVVSGAGTIGKVKWELTPRYYNLTINQSENANKSFGGRVEIANLSCSSEEYEEGTLAYQILNNNGGLNYINGRSSPDLDLTASSNEGMFPTMDNYGTSYYFRGAVDNNWVKFGKDEYGYDMWWRIIRINGDSSIRLIYSGINQPRFEDRINYNCENIDTSIEIPGLICATSICDVPIDDVVAYIEGYDSLSFEDKDCMIDCVSGFLTHDCNLYAGVSNFNRPYDNFYISGYMYDDIQYRGNTNNSLMKHVIDKWYLNNLIDYDDYIADSLFCNDRIFLENLQILFMPNPNLFNNEYMYRYGFRFRSDFGIANLRCLIADDSFTVSSNKGNKKLTYPIGLISGDELSFAGLTRDIPNKNSYLYSGQTEWTMTPDIYGVYDNLTYYAFLDYRGIIDNYYMDNFTFWRPVISIKNTKSFSGSGYWNSPYVIIMD